MGILGGLFEQPFGVFDIAVAAYDGNNGEDIEDFEAPATAAVGTFATGGLEVGQLITF